MGNYFFIIKLLHRGIIVYLLNISFLFTTAQTTEYNFTNYTTTQGLCNNKIYGLSQDSRGFMWIATIEGLSRFDGKNFKNFYAAKNDSIAEGNVFSTMYEYKKGHLVLRKGEKIICFNTYTEKFYKSPVTDIKDLGSLRSAKGNNYYVSAIDKAYILNNNLEITDSITNLPFAIKKTWVAPYYFSKDIILLDYNSSSYFYYPAKKKYETIPVVFNFPDSNRICSFRYYDTIKHELFFNEYILGLYRYSLATKKTAHLNIAANGLHYVPASTYQIISMGKEELWFLTEGGINILNTRKNTISTIRANSLKNNSLINNQVFTGYKDKDDNFWIGTVNGLSKLNANTSKIKSWAIEFNTIYNNELMSVIKGPDGYIYASVYGGGASTINTRTDSLSHWKHPLNTNNWNLFVKGDEVIRTGGGNSLLSLNTTTKQFKVLDFLKPYYPDIELITFGFVHSNGDEWYCANHGGGFVRKLAGSNNFKTYKKNDGINHFSNGYYSCHTEDKKGDLWFGVNKASKLLHWNFKTDSFNEIEFNTIKGTENSVYNGINDVTNDAAGNIWVAYEGSGLVQYNPVSNTATHYTLTNGLPTNHIEGLQFDNKNRLWLNTINGLCCFLIADNKFINFKTEDGLPDDHFTGGCHYFDAIENKLWVGAGNTLMSFNPDELLDRSGQSFPVYIDEIYIGGKRYTDTLQNNLSLNPSQNNLQFHFVGVDLSKGKDIEYSYTLQGADKDWNYNGTNQSASYANLEPGKYTFKVRARYKGETTWIEIEEPLHFAIATPWNKSWWFILLVMVIIGFVIWLISRAYYLRRIEKQKAIIEKQQAISNERSRIAADMHDDMGAGLSRMRYLSAAMKNETQNEGLKKNLDNLIAGSDELVDKMNDIIWTLNSGDEKLEDALYYIRSQCSEILNNANINFECSLPDSIPPIMINSEQKRNLYLVIKEAVHNIVKHSGATKADLQVQINKQLKIIVADNGKGFDVEKNKLKGNGISNYQKRMIVLKGSFDIQSSERGTEVVFEIPPV